ncbi:flagellar motor switch protein FliM [Actinokineospora globicatena]|uniref:Flagellar motor switch protein FliM n=1 Tax=Actinokineospora globicatena TaxID=103729 RepID=A0A9W6VBN7_9PSEU|nr:flagellar motor switch protein FliM [Actinokineospora globicatena]GLW88434.1 flagellar motor switch protein FliM [Actinokineospora globicatena]GLW93153.1 flagellar motor switch protein FliM [Actinokineospora globicatena]
MCAQIHRDPADRGHVQTPSSSPGRRAGGAKTGGLVTDGRALASYDFLRPAKLPREHLRTLQLAYETFSHRLAILLTSQLRVVCRVGVAAVDQISTDEFLARETEPVVVAPLRFDPLPGTAILELPQVTALTLIDHLLGGPGGKQHVRPLTDLETPLIRDLLADVLTELKIGLAEFVRVDPILGALEYNPQLVQVGGPADVMVTANFELTVGEAESTLTLTVPLQSVLPSLQRHSESAETTAGERAAQQAARDLLTQGLREVPVDVAVRFAPAKLRSNDLFDLRPGDLLSLGHPVSRPLDITTAGRVFGHAVATKQGNRLACQVVSANKEDFPG